MSPWIGTGAHDGDLDHQIVELLGLAGAAAWSSAPGFRPGRRRPCRHATSWHRHRGRRRARPPDRGCARRPFSRAKPWARQAASMPSAEHIDLGNAERVRDRPCPIRPRCGRPSPHSDRHHFVERLAGMTKPPTCCDRWRKADSRQPAARLLDTRRLGVEASSRTRSSLRSPPPGPRSRPKAHRWCRRRQADRLADLADSAERPR